MERNKSLHAHIKSELLAKIKANTYKVGEQIPTELALCKTFDASRTTIRTALNQLTLEGYLTRKQGKGTYVSDRKVSQTLSNTVHKYSDQVQDQGKRAKIIVQQINVIPATETIQQSLDVAINDPIQRIERLRLANDEPTQYEIAYIPWKTAPGITKQQAEHSIYGTLRDKFSVIIAKTRENIEITLADDTLGAHLQCESGLPLFYIETIAEDEHGEKIEYSQSYYRGDKTNFIIERNYTP